MNHNVCLTAIDVVAMLYFEHAYSLFFGIPNALIRVVDMMLGGILMIFNYLKVLIFLQRIHFICTLPLPFVSSLPQYLQRSSR